MLLLEAELLPEAEQHRRRESRGAAGTFMAKDTIAS
jgi:hypothetical protein